MNNESYDYKYNKLVFVVDILCMTAEDKSYTYTESCDSLVDIGRTLIAFKPKRGYEVVNINVQRQLEFDFSAKV